MAFVFGLILWSNPWSKPWSQTPDQFDHQAQFRSPSAARCASPARDRKSKPYAREAILVLANLANSFIQQLRNLPLPITSLAGDNSFFPRLLENQLSVITDFF
jgi:hypothetical protein